MNKFSIQCEKIIEEMLLEAKTIIPLEKKNEIRNSIRAIMSEQIPSTEKAEKLKEVKRSLFASLWDHDYMRIKSYYVRNPDGEIELPSKNVNKVQDIIEQAIEILAGEDHSYRQLSKSHIAECLENKENIL